MKRVVSALILACSVLTAKVSLAQSWTPVQNVPNIGAYNPTLLTDGSVIVQDAAWSDWWKLTPDSSGNYATGTWTQLATVPNFGPLYYASAVLPDGRFFTMGGEYNMGNGPLWQNSGYIYDPVLDAWTPIAAPSGWSQIGDMASITLPNGMLMLLDPLSNQSALFDPLTNTLTGGYGKGKSDGNDEEGVTLLPDGTVLLVETNANQTEIFNPSTQMWTFAGNTPASLVGGGEEIGPQVLRPDGTVICFGGGGHNCIYNFNTKTWSQAPDFPVVAAGQLDCKDAPACLLPNGNVLVMTSQDFNNGVQFFEWDGSNLNPVPNTPNSPNIPAFAGNMLMLPNGQVMVTDQSSGIMLYNPVGSPNPSWAPTITSVSSSLSQGASYLISGIQFNGLSGCSAYGDDEQNFTNYPIIRITNTATGDVTYCREYNPSTMGICTGTQIVSTHFEVPSSLELGPSTIQVVTNGIASAPVSITVVPAVTSFTINPGSVQSGNVAFALLGLAQPAPAGGSPIPIFSNNSAVIVPTIVTVPAGSKSLKFPISTTAVSANTTATISANGNASPLTATLTVIPPTLAGLAIAPGTLVGGATAIGTINLNGLGVPGGSTITLSSTSGVTVPATVTIPAGATTATFAVTTSGVSSSVVSTVTATLNGSTESATITVNSATFNSFSLSSPTVVGSNPVSGTLSLSGAAPPSGIVIALSTNSKVITLPASITIPAGSSSATFSIQTASVSTTQTAAISATSSVGFQSANLTVTPPSLSAVSLSQSSAIGGSSTVVTGTITFTGEVQSQSASVSLTSSNPALVSVNSTVKLSKGQESATFNVNHHLVKSVTSVTITAKYGGIAVSTTLTLTPFTVTVLTITPSSLAGGNAATGIVTLNANVGTGSGALSVKLGASSGSVTLPATVSIAPGKSSGTFTVKTDAVSAPTTATVTATYLESSQQTSLSITPATLISVSASPSTVKGSSSTSVVGTVTLSGLAPAGGAVVNLASSQASAASVPTTVKIPAGSKSVTFKINHFKVTSSTPVKLTATLASTAQTTTLTVTP